MVNKTYIESKLLFHEKLTVPHAKFNIESICEIKIWQIRESINYPFGIKYSLFCVEKKSKKVVVGFDNHFPKGPHIHLDNLEIDYVFLGYEKLVGDFWDEVKKRGFKI